MEITLNGKSYKTKEQQTIDELLQELEQFEKDGVAVAVNETVVPKKEWDNYALNEGSSVEIIKAVQGG